MQGFRCPFRCTPAIAAGKTDRRQNRHRRATGHLRHLRPTKLDERGCNGSPDWIIEILSKATSQKDLTDKFDLYRYAGVREYWVVHPNECTVIPYRLNEQGEYQPLRPNPFVTGEKIPVGIFPDFAVDLGEVFS